MDIELGHVINVAHRGPMSESEPGAEYERLDIPLWRKDQIHRGILEGINEARGQWFRRSAKLNGILDSRYKEHVGQLVEAALIERLKPAFQEIMYERAQEAAAMASSSSPELSHIKAEPSGEGRALQTADLAHGYAQAAAAISEHVFHDRNPRALRSPSVAEKELAQTLVDKTANAIVSAPQDQPKAVLRRTLQNGVMPEAKISPETHEPIPLTEGEKLGKNMQKYHEFAVNDVFQQKLFEQTVVEKKTLQGSLRDLGKWAAGATVTAGYSAGSALLSLKPIHEFNTNGSTVAGVNGGVLVSLAMPAGGMALFSAGVAAKKGWNSIGSRRRLGLYNGAWQHFVSNTSA